MKKDESFSKFLDIKRGAAMHTLESLMLLPVREREGGRGREGEGGREREGGREGERGLIY